MFSFLIALPTRPNAFMTNETIEEKLEEIEEASEIYAEKVDTLREYESAQRKSWEPRGALAFD